MGYNVVDVLSILEKLIEEHGVEKVETTVDSYFEMYHKMNKRKRIAKECKDAIEKIDPEIMLYLTDTTEEMNIWAEEFKRAFYERLKELSKEIKEES